MMSACSRNGPRNGTSCTLKMLLSMANQHQVILIRICCAEYISAANTHMSKIPSEAAQRKNECTKKFLSKHGPLPTVSASVEYAVIRSPRRPDSVTPPASVPAPFPTGGASLSSCACQKTSSPFLASSLSAASCWIPGSAQHLSHRACERA